MGVYGRAGEREAGAMNGNQGLDWSDGRQATNDGRRPVPEDTVVIGDMCMCMYVRWSLVVHLRHATGRAHARPPGRGTRDFAACAA